jgi:formylglycine-generating enzyme required for sulfatase activity
MALRHRCSRGPALVLVCALVVFAGAAAASEPGMVRIAGGSFTMGSDRGLADERP